jgi:hypothetical protein
VAIESTMYVFSQDYVKCLNCNWLHASVFIDMVLMCSFLHGRLRDTVTYLMDVITESLV